MELYGDILLRQWETAPAADKQEYLALLQARWPEWILPYADRLIWARQLDDATLWAQTALDYADQRTAFVVLGRAALEQGDSATAETWFAQAYEQRQDRETAAWYGLLLATGNDPVRGTALLEEAVAATASDHPERPWLLVMTGIGAARSGDCAKASAIWNQAAATDPSQKNQDFVVSVREQYRQQCP